jgi:hypothetical protein
MAYTDEQLKKASKNAELARKLLDKNSKSVGKNLRVTIDNDTQELVSNKPVVNINQAIQEIGSSWRKTAEAIINTCLIIQQYREAGNWRQISEELIKRKVIPEITLKQLVAISNNKVLMNPKYVAQLPATQDTIYKASQIREEELKDLFESKKIQPSMTSKDFKELSSNLPRRNVHFDRTKEREKKATEVSFTIKVKIPVENYKSTQNRIVKEIKNYYFDEDFVFEPSTVVKFHY